VADQEEPVGGHRSGRWTVLAIALASQIATSVVAFALPVLLPFVKSEYHLTFAAAGLVVNFAFVGVMLTTALAGWAVDAFGDRFVLITGCLVTGVAAIVCGLAPNLAVLLAVLVLMGGGIGTTTPAGSIAVRSAFSVYMRATVMGIRQTGVPIGALLGALVLPWIAVRGGWRDALAVAGVMALAMAILTRAVYRPVPRSDGPNWRGLGLLQTLTREIAVASGAGLLLVAGQIAVMTYLVAFLIHDRGMGVTAAGAYLGAANLAGAVGRVAWGILSDRMLGGSRRYAILLAGATAALGSAGLAFLPIDTPTPVLGVAVLVCAVGAIGWNGVQISLLSELAAPGAEGRAVGMGIMLQQPGMLIGPFLFGLVVDASGSFRAAWLLLVAYFVLAILVISAVREAPRSSSDGRLKL
jgi:MFS family permease